MGNFFKKILPLALSLVAIPLSLPASENQISDDICSDLYSYTCSGRSSDPTGSVTAIDAEKAEGEFDAALRKHVYEKFKELVNSPANIAIRKKAATAFNVDEDVCSPSKIETEDCTDVLASGFSMIAAHTEFSSSDKNLKSKLSKSFDLQSVESLMDNLYVELAMRESTEAAKKDLVKESSRTQIITQIFPKIKEQFSKLIEANVENPKQRTKMLEKLNAIELQFDCQFDIPKAANRISAINAFSDGKRIDICEGMLRSITSEFGLVMAIAHEIGHAFDPCAHATNEALRNFLGDYSKSDYPLDIISCLKRKDSVGARTDIKMIPQWPPLNLPSDCKSQLGEATADWLGFEVLANYMKENHSFSPQQSRQGYKNAFPFCRTTGEEVGYKIFTLFFDDPHPKSEDRVNKLMLAQPEIRRQMGCGSQKPGLKYCEIHEGKTPKKAKEKSGDKERAQ